MYFAGVAILLTIFGLSTALCSHGFVYVERSSSRVMRSFGFTMLNAYDAFFSLN